MTQRSLLFIHRSCVSKITVKKINDPGNDLFEMVKHKLTVLGTSKKESNRPAWQKNMDKLKKAIDHTFQEERQLQQKKTCRELYYALEIPSHYNNEDALVLRILQKEQLKSGYMGRLKNYQCHEYWNHILDKVTDAQDIRIISMFGSHLRKSYRHSSSTYLMIPKVLSLSALNEIDQTGRLIAFYKDDSLKHQDYEALSFKEDDPSVFRPRVFCFKKIFGSWRDVFK